MNDAECVDFLRWALAPLDLRWPGFRRVRRQVCKRLRRRLAALGLESLDEYRAFLESHPAEWRAIDAACRITISRFYRDRGVFDFITRTLLPALAEDALAHGRGRLSAWSAGCASGEEPYSLALAWRLAVAARCPSLELGILATDADAGLIARAAQARYPAGALRDLPDGWESAAFETLNGARQLRASYARMVTFQVQDVRDAMPVGPFDVVLCRNLVFTYFAAPLAARTLARVIARLRPGGALVIGIHERLPGPCAALTPWSARHRVYRKQGAP